MAGNLFEELDNPFEHIGLNQQAVEALINMRDPEALTLAVNGVRLALSRVFHPDSRFTVDPASAEFFKRLNDASTDLEAIDQQDVLTFAQAYVGQRRGRRPKTSASEKVSAQSQEALASVVDKAQLLKMMADLPYGELGLTLDPNTRLLLLGYDHPDDGEDAFWRTFQRADTESYQLVTYRSKKVSELTGLSEDEVIAFNQTLAANLPCDELLNQKAQTQLRQTRSRRVQAATPERLVLTNAALEVKSDGTITLYDESRKMIVPSLTELELARLLSEPGLYEVSIKGLADGSRVALTECALVTRFINPDMENATEADCRILGSVDKSFMSKYISAISHYYSGTPKGAKLPVASRGFPVSPPAQYRKDLGRKVPDNFINLLAQSFTPDIDSDRLLVVAQHGSIIVAGRILKRYQN